MGKQFLVELPDDYSGIKAEDIKRYITSPHYIGMSKGELVCVEYVEGELFESEEIEDKSLHVKVDRIESLLCQLIRQWEVSGIGGVR